jgi:hypothetical protein
MKIPDRLFVIVRENFLGEVKVELPDKQTRKAARADARETTELLGYKTAVREYRLVAPKKRRRK